MHPYTLALSLGALVLASAPIALAHGDDEHKIDRQDVRATFTLERFGDAELNMGMVTGNQVAFTIQTGDGTPIYVDVHAHGANGTEQFYTEQNATKVAHEFTAPADGTYSIMMTREARGAVEVTLAAKGMFEILSTSGFELEAVEDSPLPVVLPAFVVLALAVASARTRRP